MTATGTMATWCPVHGQCTCPEHSLDDPACPLHAPESKHGDDR